MRSLRGPYLKLGAFGVVAVLVLALLYVVFAQLRFESSEGYHAVFTDSSGLKSGDFVRVAGVEVGKVSSVRVVDNSQSQVDFSVSGMTPTSTTKAVVRYANLIGDRYLELVDPDQRGAPLAQGTTIPTSMTEPALDLDALLGGFQPLFKTLDADTVNTLSMQIVHLLQGEGGTVEQIFSQIGTLTNGLADRDQLIGQVIDNLNVVLGSVANYKDSLSNGLGKLQTLVTSLAQQADPIAQSVAHISDAAGAVGDLLADQRPALQGTIDQLNQVTGNINSDKDFLDALLTRLPADYRTLSRLGLYGDFFGFYMCDVTLKINGPDHGEPLYIDVAKQNAGRCKP